MFNKSYDQNLQTLYDSREGDFEIFFFNLNRYLKYFNMKTIEKDTKFLDLGSSDNSLQKAMLKHDIKINSLNEKNCNFETDKINFENDYFDFVLMKAIIEHINNPQNILNEIKRVLKKGGTIIITTSNLNFVPIKSFWNDPTHVHPYNDISLKNLLKILDFKNICVRPFVFNKPSFYWKMPFWFAANIPFKNHTFKKFPIPKFLRGQSTVMLATANK